MNHQLGCRLSIPLKGAGPSRTTPLHDSSSESPERSVRSPALPLDTDLCAGLPEVRSKGCAVSLGFESRFHH